MALHVWTWVVDANIFQLGSITAGSVRSWWLIPAHSSRGGGWGCQVCHVCFRSVAASLPLLIIGACWQLNDAHVLYTMPFTDVADSLKVKANREQAKDLSYCGSKIVGVAWSLFDGTTWMPNSGTVSNGLILYSTSFHVASQRRLVLGSWDLVPLTKFGTAKWVHFHHLLLLLCRFTDVLFSARYCCVAV